MGWYLKKRFGFGPLRLNLSRSGLGASAGVTGLRVNKGPKGTILNAGRDGICYRKTLSASADALFSDMGMAWPNPDRRTIVRKRRTAFALILRGILGGLMRGGR